MSKDEDLLDIPEPGPAAYPRKVNFFEGLITANTQLGPLFAYTHPGAILTLFIFQRGDYRPQGVFGHKNSCDEVLICLGSSVGYIRPGQVLITPREHDVPGIASGNSEDYMCMLYFQRQPLEENQKETVGFRCEKCGNVLHSLEFSGSNAAAYTNKAGRPLVPTVAGSVDAVIHFNTDEAVRHCGACGHHSPPFPSAGWGWEQYMANADIAARAELSLRKLAG